MSRLLLAFLVATQYGASVVRAAMPAAKARVMIVAVDGQPPAGDAKFRIALSSGGKPIDFASDAWSEWIALPLAEKPDAVQHFTCSVTAIGAKPGTTPRIQLTAESVIDGRTEKCVSDADLFGPSLGFVVWKEKDAYQIDTCAGQARRVYGPALLDAAIPVEQRPKKFVLGERYIGADTDAINWRENLGQLGALGFNAIHQVPAPMVDDARRAGFTRVWGAVYNPPGYAFNFAADRHDQFLKFVNEQIAPAIGAGWTKDQIGFWFTSDEPGWYYPAQYEELNKDPRAMEAFHVYLQQQKLTPADLGKSSWDEVKLIGRKQFTDLPSRRLFYWSNRFVPWASSQFFGAVAKAYEEVIRPGVPVMINFNNFIGRFYQPGPVGNNAAKTDPNAAMGQHDWLEFGRARGMTCTSTEDWFGDDAASQWSFYMARLRSGSDLGGTQFGALIIPRASGQKPMGMPQKLLTIIGSGAKTVFSFTFGPEYAFPGNCWSENQRVFKPLGEAMRIVGRAEDLLYPGKPRTPQVAILSPQSSQLWDLEDQGVVSGLMDVTNASLFAHHMLYESETYAIYRALQHSAIPARFVDEQALVDLTGLKDVRVLYVTAPDLPAESIAGLLKWVAEGGTLVTVAGTGLFDRYHQPSDVLTKATGISVEYPPRPIVPAKDSTAIGSLDGADAFGAVEGLDHTHDTKVVLNLNDSEPAILEKGVGKGRIIHFAAFPGYSYFRSSGDVWRQRIIAPIGQASVPMAVTVNAAKIEAPALYSDAGVAVTLLNWSNKPQDVELSIAVDKPVQRVESVYKGNLEFKSSEGRVTVKLPLAEVDVVMLRY